MLIEQTVRAVASRDVNGTEVFGTMEIAMVYFMRYASRTFR